MLRHFKVRGRQTSAINIQLQKENVLFIKAKLHGTTTYLSLQALACISMTSAGYTTWQMGHMLSAATVEAEKKDKYSNQRSLKKKINSNVNVSKAPISSITMYRLF